jgi:hypothetical protein
LSVSYWHLFGTGTFGLLIKTQPIGRGRRPPGDRIAMSLPSGPTIGP